MPPLAYKVIKGFNSGSDTTQICTWSEFCSNKHCVNNIWLSQTQVREHKKKSAIFPFVKGITLEW